VLRGEHEQSDRHSSSALDRGMPSRESYLPLVVLACRRSRTSRSGRRTLLDQAEQSFRKALDGARQTSMVHGLHEARRGGSMCERLVKAAKACPSQAQSMRQSCSAHLLSIRLVCISTPRCAYMWRSQMLCFHVTVDDDGRSRRRQPTGSMRNSAAHRTSWFAVDGSAARRRQSRYNGDLTEIVIKRQILPT
jgi:hypothetical protein